MIALPPDPPAIVAAAPEAQKEVLVKASSPAQPPSAISQSGVKRVSQPEVVTPANAHEPTRWRSRLSNRGIDLTLGYASESAVNLDGGRERGAAYTHQFLASVAVDTGKAFGLEGGRFVATMIERTGVDLTTQRIGNLFQVQELWGGGGDVRPAEITYEQKFAKTAVKFGLFHTGDDFATLTTACNFQSFAFCPRPTSLFLNTAFSGFPIPRWGLRVRQEVAPGVFLSTAIMEVNGFRARTGHGFDLAPRFDSYVFPVEISWKSGQKPGGKPGFVRFGGVLDTTNKPDLYRDTAGGSFVRSGLPAVQRQERWSAWLLGEKMVHRFGPGARGLTVFGDVSVSDLHTARVPLFLSAGVVARGLADARPADGMGFALAYARVNPRLERGQREAVARGRPVAVQDYEMSAEMFYAWQVRPNILVRPNLQYIHRVGATTRYRDAKVAGLTLRISA